MDRAAPIVGFFDIDTVLRGIRGRPTVQAADALARLDAEGIAMVLCSTKTRAELERLQLELGVRHPFICEGGSAVFVPAGYFNFRVNGARAVPGYHVVELGRGYGVIVETLHRVARRLKIAVRGFNDMSIEEVAVDQRLPLLQARLAKLREYGEVFRIHDERPEARSRLFRALQFAHLRCAVRSLNNHVTAFADIGRAAARLRSTYEQQFGHVTTFAVMDVESDGTLRGVVDHTFRLGDRDSPLNGADAASSKGAAPVLTLAGVVEATYDAVTEIHKTQVH
jgi:mannosyl-3-phosphoglycerate phosphatase